MSRAAHAENDQVPNTAWRAALRTSQRRHAPIIHYGTFLSPENRQPSSRANRAKRPGRSLLHGWRFVQLTQGAQVKQRRFAPRNVLQGIEHGLDHVTPADQSDELLAT